MTEYTNVTRLKTRQDIMTWLENHRDHTHWNAIRLRLYAAFANANQKGGWAYVVVGPDKTGDWEDNVFYRPCLKQEDAVITTAAHVFCIMPDPLEMLGTINQALAETAEQTQKLQNVLVTTNNIRAGAMFDLIARLEDARAHGSELHDQLETLE